MNRLPAGLVVVLFNNPITVEVRDATAFYVAENDHQDFYKKNAMQYRLFEFNCARP